MNLNIIAIRFSPTAFLYKLREAEINIYIPNINDRNRNDSIEIGENQSESFKPNVGMPQKAISPIVFIFYIADTFQDCKGKTKKYVGDATQVSAGDTMLFRISKRLRGMHKMGWQVAC